MSNSSTLSQHTVAVIQTYVDSLVESTIIQSMLTGLYALLFFQAIVPLIRRQKWYIVAALSTLFVTIILNMGAVWAILRSVVVTHDATRETMALDLFTGPSRRQQMASGTLALSVIVADSFLAWRCYVLWQNNKFIGIVYSVIFLAELAILPVYLARNLTLGPRFGFLDLYFAISLVVTISFTGLILYRILDVSRQGNNEISRYTYTIEVLVESGMLYTAVIIICSALHLASVFGVKSPAIIQVTQDFDAILVPITGIAPTMITARNAASRSRDQIKRDVEAPEHGSKPISRLSFRRDDSTTGRVYTLEDSNRASQKINQISTV